MTANNKNVINNNDHIWFKALHVQNCLTDLSANLKDGCNNYTVKITLEGNFDEERFVNSLKCCISKNSMLNARFKTIDGLAMYTIVDQKPNIEIIQCENTQDDFNREITNCLYEFADHYDLLNDVLYRIRIVENFDRSMTAVIMNFHRIIFDEHCIGVFVQDLEEAYCSGNINDKGYQYNDYVQWRSEMVNSVEYEKQKKYWQNIFEEQSTLCDLLVDNQHNKSEMHRSAKYSSNIDIEGISDFCNRAGCTYPSFFAAVISVVLSSLTYQKDITIGINMAERILLETNNVIGNFTNILPLRNNINLELAAMEFVKQVHANTGMVLKNANIEYETIAEIAGIENESNQLFDVAFRYQKDYANVLNLKGYSCKTEVMIPPNSMVDFEICISECAGCYKLEVNYAEGLYDLDTIETFSRNLKKVITRFILNENIKLCDACEADEYEIDLIQNKFNNTTTQYPFDNTTFSSILEERAKVIPDNIALIYGENKLTYCEFLKRVNSLAAYLQELGVGPEDFVAIYTERSIEMIIGIYAILRAGGAYVPISPMYQKERIEYILNDCKPKAVLVYGTQVDIPSLTVIDLSIYEYNNESRPLRPVDTSLDNLIYCIYTSGTTGNPKGVMNTHKGLMNVVQWMQNRYPLNEDDVIIQKTTYVFDVSASEIFWWSMVGASLVIPEPGAEKDPIRISEIIEQNRVSVIDFVPSMLSAFMSVLDENKEAAGRLKSLKYVLAAGEALNSEVVNMFYCHAAERYPKALLANIYGPTEASIYSSYYDCTAGMNKVPIGRPIANCQLYIVANGKLCGIGVPGELCIAGKGVAKGYLKLQELTSEKFTKNPYGKGTIYHSGDLARWMPDGNIEYLGRIDNQVKVRGFRIELGEVENAFRKISRIKDVAVIVKTGPYGDKAMFAYYVSDSKLITAHIRYELEKHLPQYMIPSYITRIDAIPLTSNGKLNRRVLSEIEVSYDSVFVEAKTEEERILCEILKDVLNIKSVSISDSFISLGGDSIKAIRVMSKLHEKEYDISISNIMGEKTIADIAVKLIKAEQRYYEQAECSGSIISTPIIETFNLWDLCQPEHYNQSVTIKVHAAPEDVKKVLDVIWQQHDILRSIYREQELEILSVSDSAPYEFQVIGVDSFFNESEKVRRIKNSINESFILEEGPLFKVVYFNCVQASYLFLCAHHLIIDGVSWRIIIEDLRTGLQKLSEASEVILPQKTASYIEWAKAVFDYRDSLQLKYEKEYWDDIEKQLDKGKLPFVNTSDYSDYKDSEITFSENFTKKLLRESGFAFNTTVNDLLIAAMGMAIHKITGQEYVVIGLEGHGREKLDTEIRVDRTVGWFTSIYPIVLHNNPNIDEQIINSKATLRRVPNHGFGYGILNRKKLLDVDVFFNYLGRMDESSDIDDEISIIDGLSVAQSNRLLGAINFNSEIQRGILRFKVFWDSAAVSETTIQQLLEVYKGALIEIVENCATKKEGTKTLSDYTASDLTLNDLNQLKDRYADLEDIYIMSSLQEGILFNCRMNPETTAYRIQVGYNINGKLDIGILNNALDLLARRYSVLCSVVFDSGTKRPYQVVLETMRPTLEYYDYSEYDKETGEDLFLKLVSYDKEQEFNFEEGPLARVKCVKLSKEHYRLILSFHHIIMDGWSIGVFIHNLQKYYNIIKSSGIKIAEQQVDTDKRTGSDFDDFSKMFTGKEASAEKGYWKELLEGFDGANRIEPMDKNITIDKNVGIVRVAIDVSMTEKLSSILPSYNVTMNTFAEAVWGVLLQKYNYSEDAVFGKVVSGRDALIPGIENILGIFINTIPVRVSGNSGDKFVEIVQKLQLQSSESMIFSRCSLADIISGSKVGSHLINTVLVFENYPAQTVDEDGELYYEQIFINEDTDYDITVRAGIYRGELTFDFLYNPSIYNHCEIELISNNFINIINQFIDNPDSKLCEILSPGKEDRNKILNDFNDSYFDIGQYRNVISSFENQVTRNPENIAVIYADKKVNYRDFNDMSNALAHKLINIGVHANDFVVIMAERSIEMILGIYAVLKAGGAYVPVDSKYPEERINFIINDCKPKAVLVYNAEISIDIQVPVIDLSENDIFEGDTNNPQIIIEPEDAIYCMYTSGTTGRPKGVVNKHRGLMNIVSWLQKEYPLNDGDTMLQKTTYIFDISASEIFWWSTVGATLVLLGLQAEKDPVAIAETIEKNKISHIDFVPSMLSAFLVSLSGDNEAAKKIKCLKYVLACGEVLNAAVVNQFYKLAQSIGCEAKLANIYGPTEASIYSTYYNCSYGIQTVPIGKPAGNYKIYMLNDQTLCGIGIPGELCIAGEGVAKGYLNLPELTEQKFIQNPFGNGKLYRTGDLARWNINGEIDYLGRFDDQVKVRGFRIELGEIERAIRSLENIKECAVIARPDYSNEMAVFAYLVSDEKISTTQIKDKLGKLLPEYMVPGYIAQIDKIPITLNGKLNRKELPVIEMQSEKEYVPARNSTEEKLCKLYENILHLDKIGIKDNFFDLGGHSLRATRLVNRIKTEICSNISLRHIFMYPAVEQLSEAILSLQDVQSEMIPYAENKEYYPMSSAQKRIYIVSTMDSDGIAYNIPQNFKIYGSLDVEKLKHALSLVISRHEILRTDFLHFDNIMVQRIRENVELDFEVVNDVDITDEDLMCQFVRPFDLQQAPLVRIKVVLRSDYSLLMLDIHHIVADGMSLVTFITELSDAYNGLLAKNLPKQYKDYSEWMSTRNISNQKDYWIKQFSNEVPILDIPTDYRRPSVQRFRGALVRIDMEDILTEKIRNFIKQTGLTEYMVYLSALMVLLSKYSRQDDIVVGSPVSARTHEDTEGMLGMFVNTLAMRGFPKAETTCQNFFNEIKNTCLQAYENQEYPFEELVENINVVRDFSRNPLFDVSLSLQNNEEQKLYLAGTQCEQFDRMTQVAKYDLAFNIYSKEDKNYLEVEYDRDLYKEKTAEFLAKHYIKVIEDMIEEPSTLIGDIQVISDEERKLILGSFNDTKTSYPRNSTIVELLEEQVNMNPEHTAVVCGERSLTYAQLNARANTLAKKLRETGVGPDDFVAIIMEKSIEMLVGICGILKAGGAYVPIDNNYPQSRIEYMMKDCAPKVVLHMTEDIDTNICKINLSEVSIQVETLENLEHVNKATDLAYLIYTSGTTGQPKGSAVEQRSVVRLVKNTNYIEFDENSVILQTGSMAFDASTLEIWGSLLNGGTLVIAKEEIITDSRRLKHEIELNGVNIMWMTSTLYNQMILTDKYIFDKLKVLLIGGEKLSEDHVRMLKDHESQVRLINGYGPTENTTFTTTYEIPAEFEKIPIGRPIANTQVYIMDGNNLCGINVPGELCISGDGLARGYLNHPELTKEKYIKNPYGEGNVYRSGDLARWLPDGNIEYLGRIDEQVKIRGFRIELGEIESTIRKLEGIRDCAVMVREDACGDKAICAYLVSDNKINLCDIRENLGHTLPEYMIPAYMMQIEAIPVTSNGKLDKRSLPCIEVKSESVYTAPQNIKEQILCEVFEEILGVNKIGIYDSFYQLGGDSIKAIRIISKLRSKGYSVSIRDIMYNYTPNAIAQIITPIKETYSQDEVSGIVQVTPIFKEFFSWKLPLPHHFNQSSLFPIEGISRQMIDIVMTEIVKHYDTLRMVYRNGVLEILNSEESKMYDFTYCDLSNKSEYMFEIQKVCDIKQSSIDLQNGPIVKVVMFTTDYGDYLFLCIHHFAVDGVSWRILINDINEAFDCLKQGKSIKLSEKTASFIQWAEALNSYGQSAALKSEISYWEKVVEHSKQSGLKFDISDHKREYKQKQIEFNYEETNNILYKSNAAFNSKPQELFLTALGMTFKQLMGNDAITVCLEGHGRENIDRPISIENTVGWFTTMYPIVIECSGDVSKDMINTKETCRKVPNGGLGYGLLKDKLQTLHMDIYFNYLGEMDSENELVIAVGKNVADENEMPYVVSLNGYVIKNQLVFDLSYDVSKFDEKNGEKLVTAYKKNLNDLAIYCSKKENMLDVQVDLSGFEIEQSDLDIILSMVQEDLS